MKRISEFAVETHAGLTVQMVSKWPARDLA